jgi:hypothetical protein
MVMLVGEAVRRLRDNEAGLVQLERLRGDSGVLAKIWSWHTGFITYTFGIPTDLCEWLCVLRLSIN